MLTETSLQTQLTVNAFCRSHTPPIKASFMSVDIKLAYCTLVVFVCLESWSLGIIVINCIDMCISICSSLVLMSMASSVGRSVTLDPVLMFMIQMEKNHVKCLSEILQR